MTSIFGDSSDQFTPPPIHYIEKDGERFAVFTKLLGKEADGFSHRRNC